MSEEIADLKNSIRARVRAQRGGLTDAEKSQIGEQLLEQLKMLIVARGARSVSCYFPVQGEPNTIPFLNWAIANEITVLLPKSREDGLLDWVVYTGSGLEPGLYGIPEPAGEELSPLSVSEVDLMLVPASAIDASGNRLGWGRGYFDKSLGSMEQSPPVFAIVHDSEIVETVPSDLHDIPVTGAVTPTKILHFHTE